MHQNDLKKLFKAPFKGVSIDSRTLVAGQPFVALKGEQFDGHLYVPQAVERGASAVVVEKHVTDAADEIIVENTLKAYGEMARYYRDLTDVHCVALTGSCGKTTTKGLLAEIFTRFAPTHVTEKNYNNEIGVPMTLLAMPDHMKWAVLEMGANQLGEIGRLTQIAHPNIALITMIANQHTEGFGNLDGVAKEKRSILNGLTDDGVAVLPKDSPYFDYLCEVVKPGQKIFTFGMTADSEFYPKNFKPTKDSCYAATIQTPHGAFDVTLKLLGEHNVYNAVAATAVACAAGIPLDIIKAGLEAAEAVDKRCVIVPGLNQSTLIDDCYNAGPQSIVAALKVLSHYAGKKVWVFADMGELGDLTDESHRFVGEQARAFGVDELFAFGEHARLTVDAFGKGGQYFPDKAALIAALKPQLRQDMTILIKGSRKNKLETVVEALKAP